MKVSCLWCGGYGWADPYQYNTEHFNSLKEAKQTFINRFNNTDLKTPCVSETCNMWIVWGEQDFIDYPDIVLTLGPKNGIITKRRG